MDYRDMLEDLINDIIDNDTVFPTSGPTLAYKLAKEKLKYKKDDPTTDCTDLAHPAYWRGEEAGMKGTIKLVKEAIYNGMKELPLKGVVSDQEFQALRLELYN